MKKVEPKKPAATSVRDAGVGQFEALTREGYLRRTADRPLVRPMVELRQVRRHV